MTEIIIKGKKDDVLDKDCSSFIPLNDGTIHGEKKYCDLSHECRQFDPTDNMGYCSEWQEYYEFYTDDAGKIVKEKVCDYLCTGKKPIFEERSIDEEAN
jgi:hypothetical protein